MYQKARKARARFANDYENFGLARGILNTKRGSNDRAIALEDVLRKSVLQPSSSLDDLRQLRKLLHTEGATGVQAWKDLQGGTLRHIKDQALKSVATDQRGNRVISANGLAKSIDQLDKSGKLRFIFGEKGADKLRTVRDVAEVVTTAPAGAVNNSNTATVLAGLVDVAISGSAGVPAPLLSTIRVFRDKAQGARIKRAVDEALKP